MFLSELLVIVEVYVLVSVVLSTLKEELHQLIGRTTSNNVERMDRKYHNFFLKCIKIPPCIVMYSRSLSHKIKYKKIPRVHCVILNLYSF